MNLNALVTRAQASRAAGVSPHLIGMWRQAGHLQPVAHHGRSPLYRLSDILDTERQMRRSDKSHRKPEDFGQVGNYGG